MVINPDKILAENVKILKSALPSRNKFWPVIACIWNKYLITAAKNLAVQSGQGRVP